MRKRGYDMAMGAVLAALAVALLYAGCLIPSFELIFGAAAGLVIGTAVTMIGLRGGLLCWAASGLLALLVLPLKEAAGLYLIFFGLYPAVKSWLERRKNRALEWVGKLAFFNLVFAVSLTAFRAFLLEGVELPWPVLLVGGNLFLVLYDYVFSRWMTLIQFRVVEPWNRRRR